VAIMDWMFYLIIFAILFGFITVILSVRFLINRRLQKIEKKRQMEAQARRTAESNSGL
jgi:Tfp pilus assembly protein PilO